MVAIIVAFSACEKKDFLDENVVSSSNGFKENKTSAAVLELVDVKHGMLVFDNRNAFDATLKILDGMNALERKAWEESVGFKSYDRLISEIVEAQIALNEKYEKLPKEEQLALLENENYEKFAHITKKHIENGVVKIEKDENNEEHLNFADPLFPKLINEKGLVILNNNIIQYTERFYKVIRNRDFDKLSDLSKINVSTENDDYLVVELKTKVLKSTTYPINVSASSNVVDRQKVVLKEKLTYIGANANGYAEAVYVVSAEAEKRQWNRLFGSDFTQIWLYGDCKFVYWTGNLYRTRDEYVDNWWRIHETVVDITNLAVYSPVSVPESVWTASRWGGPHGITVRVTDHTEVWRDN